MATDILKQIRINTEHKDLTFSLNSEGNLFVHEGDGIEITDFWMEIPYEDWVEVVNFISHQKRDNNV